MDSLSTFLGGGLGVLLFGCFVQVIVVLSILRYSLGLTDWSVGIACALLALVLSASLVEGKLGLSGTLETMLTGKPVDFSQDVQQKARPMMKSNTDPELQQRLVSVLKPQDSESLSFLSSGFILTQLRRAFTIGAILLVPLLVVDIFVALSISLLGVTTIRAETLSIPMKILLFIAIDGWALMTGRLLEGFI